MIHEFKTDAHVVFQIDDEDLTWRRWFDPPAISRARNATGKLVFMPEINLGQQVKLVIKMYNNEVHTMTTMKVMQYRRYERANPVVASETQEA